VGIYAAPGPFTINVRDRRVVPVERETRQPRITYFNPAALPLLGDAGWIDLDRARIGPIGAVYPLGDDALGDIGGKHRRKR